MFYRIPVYSFPHSSKREKQSKESWIKTFNLILIWIFIKCLLEIFLHGFYDIYVYFYICGVFLIPTYWTIEYFFNLRRKKPFFMEIVALMGIIKVNASYSLIVNPILNIFFDFNLSNLSFLSPFWNACGILLAALYLARCISFNMNDTQHPKGYPYNTHS